MVRTITVKGIGKASAKPDYVVLSMRLEAKHMEYDKAMTLAGLHIQQLNETLGMLGFEKGAAKTTAFNVSTDYEWKKDRNGNSQHVFCGYEVTQRLKLEFDFDMDRLAQALAAISACLAEPQLSVSFTVKDSTAVNEEMLRSATVNARSKAEILCDAAGVALGDLLEINYSWGELEICSRTRFDCGDEVMACMAAPGTAIDIEPEDINVSDTATFVWAIK